MPPRVQSLELVRAIASLDQPCSHSQKLSVPQGLLLVRRTIGFEDWVTKRGLYPLENRHSNRHGQRLCSGLNVRGQAFLGVFSQIHSIAYTLGRALCSYTRLERRIHSGVCNIQPLQSKKIGRGTGRWRPTFQVTKSPRKAFFLIVSIRVPAMLGFSVLQESRFREGGSILSIGTK